MMESYIVRIYRRGQNDSGDLAGLVEMVGTSDRLSFRNFSELTSVLRRMLRQGGNDAVVKLQQQADATVTTGRTGNNLMAGHKG